MTSPQPKIQPLVSRSTRSSQPSSMRASGASTKPAGSRAQLAKRIDLASTRKLFEPSPATTVAFTRERRMNLKPETR